MKPGIVFFLYIFFHLLGGFKSVNAADCPVFAAPFQQVHKTKQVKTVHASHDYLKVKTDGSGEECVERLCAEDNDEEELIKKQTTLVRCLFDLTCAFLFSPYNSIRAKPFVACAQLSFTESDKYIVNRVLRI